MPGAGTSPSLDWSDDFALGRRRMKWLWMMGGAIVLFKIAWIAGPYVFLLIASHVKR